MVVGGVVVGGGIVLWGSAVNHTDKGGKWRVEGRRRGAGGNAKTQGS